MIDKLKSYGPNNSPAQVRQVCCIVYDVLLSYKGTVRCLVTTKESSVCILCLDANEETFGDFQH